jgi:hypothetical protein
VRTLRKFFALAGEDRWLVLKAAVAVPAARIALTLFPFSFVQRLIHEWKRRSNSPVSAGRIAWAITAVAARVPRATCLTQAVAASILLPHYGHEATLRIGVAKDEPGRIRAHAWVDSGGVTILGEPAPGAFQAFPPLVKS